jgi:hypothetical protein
MSLSNQSINSQISCLDILNQALDELGLPRPNTINEGLAFAKDFNTNQVVSILNAAGQQLCQNYDWQILRRPIYIETSSINITGTWEGDTFIVSGPYPITGEFYYAYENGNIVDYNVVTTPIIDEDNPSNIIYQSYPYTRVIYASDIITQGDYKLKFIPQVPYVLNTNNLPTNLVLSKVRFPLPNDYTSLIDGTGWDYTRHFPLIGPTTEQEWAWLVNGFVATAPRIRWAIFNNSINVYPSYNTNEKLTFVYKSNGWCGTKLEKTTNPTTANLPTYKYKIQFPSDIVFFNDRLIIAFVKYKLYSIKGLQTDALYREFNELLNIAQANDSGLKNLSLSPDLANPFISWNNIPDSGYTTFVSKF